MTITISAEDSRSVKAISIAAGAGQWLKVFGRDGRKAYGIRCSRGDRYYLVTQINCDCVDARRHPGEPCKHQLAVRLHVELAKAQQSGRRVAANAQRYDDIFASLFVCL